jgi:2-hydroxychromene-2-carboxylate isomerase
MPSPIVFFFDFGSPYAYLASEQIEAVAALHGRSVDYRPTLLGAAFKVSGQRPLPEVPLKGDYSLRDMARSARFAGIDFHMPRKFPISTVQPARAFLVLQASDPAIARKFFRQAFRAYFVHGRDISDAAILHQVLAESGADADAVMAGTGEPAIKERLKAAVEAALSQGVFGSPFFLVDGEPFWGCDRLPQMERWLASGPF